MSFVRLYGCNSRCSFCDTYQEKDDFVEMSIDEIIAEVIEDEWVCITGGEPTIHPELCLLSEALVNAGHMVALETNGTNPIPLGFHWVCVSPKAEWPTQEVFEAADEIKLLVGSEFYSAWVIVRDRAAEWTKQSKVISVQPVWDDWYTRNLRDALKITRIYGVRLSVQLHRYLEVK
jgi:organic radical activating enzyme